MALGISGTFQSLVFMPTPFMCLGYRHMCSMIDNDSSHLLEVENSI